MPEITPARHWHLPGPLKADPGPLARELNLPELAVKLMLRRGLDTAEAMRRFVTASPAFLHQPTSLPDIKPATERILAALERGERICVYGDYDVDGITGTALLVSVLRRLRGKVSWYLPHRETEGYGLSEAGIEFCRRQEAGLLITTDCGSTDHAEAALARQAGIDLVITDHHEVPAELPPALAIVNPKRPDSTYPFSELAGVGVAFKLAWSILSALSRPKEELTALLDLVGIGTIVDMVPLVGENRILARLGLAAVRATTRPGLQALMKRARIPDRPLSGHDIGFIVGPRLNAAGRISYAGISLELLLTDDPTQAARLADNLEEHNRERQTLGERTLTRAVSRIEAEKLQDQRVIVVAEDGWPKGVLGIVANKLVERYYRPCFAVALEGNEGKGSGRSINGFNLYESLKHSAEHLSGFGGHKYAAGINVERSRLPGFVEAVNRYAAGLPEEVYRPSLEVDAVCRLDEVNEELLKFLSQLEPFGPENRRPVLAALGLEVVGYPRRIGKNQNHLKLTVRSGDTQLDAVAWDRSSDLPNIEVGRKEHLDICFTVDRNTYSGRNAIQLTLRDLCSRKPEERNETTDEHG